MTALNATSKPSSSGARITGDDLQHLVVWYWCLRAIADPDGITSVAVEADDAGNVDDVVVHFADDKSKFIQVKAAVASAYLASIDWLTDRPKRTGAGKPSPSLLQKLHKSWVDLGRPATGLELITGRPLDGSDRVLALIDRHNSIGTGLRRASTQALAKARGELAGHLECTEEELCSLLDALAIRVGQTEAEWLSRVADVAASAGIRADESEVGVALAWVRNWVKDTRDPRTPEQIATAADSMGLRIENPRTVIVIQGLRREPVDDASHVLDWVERFRGAEASNRRGMINPADWNGVLSDDLAALRASLIEQNNQRVLVRGALRLPCWFALGAALRGVAGFHLAVEYRDGIWVANQNRITDRTVNILTDELRGNGPTLIVLAISTDRTDDVRHTLLSSRHGRLVTLTIEEGPHQSLLADADDALSAAVAIRDWIRANIDSREIDLVLMAPAPFAAFLGWSWDRMQTTTIYEDLSNEGYEAAFTISS
ncbi:SAVED domain-containing protein [Candidatus Poriferisocius sp.]|uniref:SAVED domain-containing protein n=1 Tax=Candidatus Poriferisocius sp. TaxID=3101276 RepID=UPI003B0297A3